MGIGPIPAVQARDREGGLKLADIDVIESNEAFAAQAMAVARDLELRPAKDEPERQRHRARASDRRDRCILTVKAIYELARTRGRYALVTMCIGGGQGIAAIFERIWRRPGAAALELADERLDSAQQHLDRDRGRDETDEPLECRERPVAREPGDAVGEQERHQWSPPRDGDRRQPLGPAARRARCEQRDDRDRGRLATDGIASGTMKDSSSRSRTLPRRSRRPSAARSGRG